MENVLEVKNLTKRYQDFIAVDNISFEVPKGKVIGLLGPNGAGKTTTIQMLNRALSRDIIIFLKEAYSRFLFCFFNQLC